MRCTRLLILLLACAGCASTGQPSATGTAPTAADAIANAPKPEGKGIASIYENLTTEEAIKWGVYGKASHQLLGPLGKFSEWGIYIAAAYLLFDPLAPNWNIEEAHYDDRLVHFTLRMNRYYAGGAGEARLVFHRRARALVRAGKFTRYEVVEYNESMESSVIGAQRVAEGVIRLI